MQVIKYVIITNKLTETYVANADSATIQLELDFTGTDYSSWTKWVQLLMNDGTEDLQALGTDAIVHFTLTSAHTKQGYLSINPKAISESGAVKGFPIRTVSIDKQLNVEQVSAELKQSIIDYFNQRLAINSVTTNTIEPDQPAEVLVEQTAGGQKYSFKIPKGVKGNIGAQIVSAAFVGNDIVFTLDDDSTATLVNAAIVLKGTKGDTGAKIISAVFVGNDIVFTLDDSSTATLIDAAITLKGLKGDKGIVWRGAYAAGTVYVIDDVVSYQGSSYICILASTGNLPTNTTYWSLFAQSGSVNETQLGLKADKLMATNLVTNGDFSNGTTGWNAIANVTQIVESGVCRFTATAQYGGVRRTFTPILGHIYYVAARFQSVSSFVRLYHSGLSAEYKVSLGTGSYEIVSNVLAATSASAQSWGVRDFRASGWTEVLFDWFMVIDLTVTFGAGKEPTLAQFEAKLALLYPSLYFDGSIEFATIRSLYNDKEDKTSVEKALVIGSKNIFNKANIISSKEVYTDGSFQNESNSKITDFIDISNHFGSIYISGLTVYAAGYNRYLWFYDASKVKIGSLITIDKSLTEYGLYVPASARYVAFSICQRKTSLEVIDLNSIQVEYGKSKTAYSNYELYASAIGSNKLYIDQTSNIQSYGKNMLIFGDSVSETATISEDGATYTEGTRMNWPINAKSNLKLGSVLNYARSGATFKDQNIVGDVRKSLSQQITLAINNGRPGDIVVVAIGTNDGVDSLGSYATAMSKTTLESLDRSNIYEAMRWGLWKIRIEYPNALCFISTPIQRASGDQPADLLTAIKAMGARYNFIVVNQHDESQIVRDFETVGSAGRYLSDGLHPNTLGQERMSDLFCSTIKRYLNK